MFETILVPLDGSELAEAAIPVALELKSRFNARIILMRAVEPASSRLAQAPGVFESPSAVAANVELLQQIEETEREEAKEYLDEAKAQLSGDGVETVVAEGEAADAIVEQAAENGAKLIIMSSHGRGGLGRLVFGSVADAVLRHSPVPVLLLRSHQ
jgi:nucleotide-binding universal stress UspA family protein